MLTGDQARAFAQVIHEHATEASGGRAYTRWALRLRRGSANPAGTSDETAALKDTKGNPVPNAHRDTWVTATALSTALNVSYMAEKTALFGIVVGIALLLAGIGFIILALGALGRHEWATFAKRHTRHETAATA